MKMNLINILLFVATTSLMAFGLVSINQASKNKPKISCQSAKPTDIKTATLANENSDLWSTINEANLNKPKVPVFNVIFEVGSRFTNTISKEDLYKAHTVQEIFPDAATKGIVSVHKTMLSIAEKDGTLQKSEEGINAKLTPEQYALIRDMDYSTDFNLRADYQTNNNLLGSIQDDYLSYWITVVPEVQAQFPQGKEVFISYLKDGVKDQTSSLEEKVLRPGRINFTIDHSGSISHVELGSSSGYPKLDSKLKTLISKFPFPWEPATNAEGETVNQTLVFFFGKMGC